MPSIPFFLGGCVVRLKAKEFDYDFCWFRFSSTPLAAPPLILVAFSVVTETENKPPQFVLSLFPFTTNITPLFSTLEKWREKKRLHGPMLRGLCDYIIPMFQKEHKIKQAHVTTDFTRKNGFKNITYLSTSTTSTTSTTCFQPSCCAQGFQRMAIGLSRCQGSPPQGFSFHTLPLVLSAWKNRIFSPRKGLTIWCLNHLNHKESYRNTTPVRSSVIIEIGNLLKPD